MKAMRVLSEFANLQCTEARRQCSNAQQAALAAATRKSLGVTRAHLQRPAFGREVPCGHKPPRVCQQLGQAQQAHAAAQVHRQRGHAKIELGAWVLLVRRPEARARQVPRRVALACIKP